MDISIITKQYDFNLAYAKSLVIDLSPVQMTTVPSLGLINHPAFTLGHLLSGSAILAKYLGTPMELPEGWSTLFRRKGPGDPEKPTLDNEKYPSKAELILELENLHECVKTLLRSIDPKFINSEFKWRYSSHMPTMLDMIAFLCINHEAMHLGQLAAWRRAMGLSSALAKL